MSVINYSTLKVHLLFPNLLPVVGGSELTWMSRVPAKCETTKKQVFTSDNTADQTVD